MWVRELSPSAGARPRARRDSLVALCRPAAADLRQAAARYTGGELGTGRRPAVGLALDPRGATTLPAKDMPNALTVIAMAPRGSLLHAPDVYMEKLAIGPGYAVDTVTLSMSPAEREAY